MVGQWTHAWLIAVSISIDSVELDIEIGSVWFRNLRTVMSKSTSLVCLRLGTWIHAWLRAVSFPVNPEASDIVRRTTNKISDDRIIPSENYNKLFSNRPLLLISRNETILPPWTFKISNSLRLLLADFGGFETQT